MTFVDCGDEPLHDRTGRGVAIAIIDSGVNPDHAHLGEIAGGVAITPEGREHSDFVDRLGHGTAVAAAIQEKAPDSSIRIVKVFDESLATSVATLVAAIDRASEQGARLVNLSLGTPNAFRADDLAPAVERAVSRGTIVVSAREHEGTSWLPGSLPGVIGVLLDWECPRGAVRAVDGLAEGITAIEASGYPRPIPGVPEERNLKGISFAVANATGVLARVLEDRPDLTSAHAVLERLGELGRPTPRG